MAATASRSAGDRRVNWLRVSLALVLGVGLWVAITIPAYRVLRSASDTIAWYAAPNVPAPVLNEGRSVRVTAP
jgi:hypothetical protein